MSRQQAQWIMLIIFILAISDSRADSALSATPSGTGAEEGKLLSDAFPSGRKIPTTYTCDGANVSPPLAWSSASGVRSFALIVEDPDAPGGRWGHWAVFNIPAMAQGLPEGVPKRETLQDGARQGLADFRTAGYGGLCPPSGAHRSFFHLYALDTTVDLSSSSRKRDLDEAMRGHVLGTRGAAWNLSEPALATPALFRPR